MGVSFGRRFSEIQNAKAKKLQKAKPKRKVSTEVRFSLDDEPSPYKSTKLYGLSHRQKLKRMESLKRRKELEKKKNHPDRCGRPAFSGMSSLKKNHDERESAVTLNW